MHIDKWLDNGEYIDEEGCCWGQDPLDFIQGHMLGFCCCGNPEANLRHIYKCLYLVNLQHEDYDRFEKERDKYFNGPQDEYFAWYVLDEKELTEHGGSIPGWLNKKGKRLMEDLEEILPILWTVVLNPDKELVKDEWCFSINEYKNDCWTQDYNPKHWTRMPKFEVVSRSIKSREHAIEQAEEKLKLYEKQEA